MATPQHTTAGDTLAACAALLEDADDVLAAALAGTGLEEALELAEGVEHLARAVYRLQVRTAGAVQAESPAAHGTRPTPTAPYRRGSDLLRTRLRITGRDARRRITTATQLLPALTLTGQSLPPVVENLAGVFTSNALPEPPASQADADQPADPGCFDIGSDAIDAILHTLHQARQVASPDDVTQADRLLTGFAATFDPDALRKLGRVVLAHLDHDGAEPDETAHRTRQGLRIGATWKDLTHLDIWADPTQLEILLSVFDAGTNPRTTTPSGPNASADPNAGADPSATTGASLNGEDNHGSDSARNGNAWDTTGNDTTTSAAPSASTSTSASTAAATAAPAGAGAACTLEDLLTRRRDDVTLSERPTLDGRTRAQQMLDILVTACQAALRTASLPTVAGLPPQVMVTMNLTDLTEALNNHTDTGGCQEGERSDNGGNSNSNRSGGGRGNGPPRNTGGDNTPTRDTPGTGLARTTHQSPIPVSQLRRLACDADLIPIVLGTHSDVLDLGRTKRLVTAPMRRALIARDGGCIFPGCTIPATWTEAHHVTPWTAGGATSVENMVLLCAHHHHAIHTGQWRITPTRAETTPGKERAQGTTSATAAPAPLLGPPTPYTITTPWTHLPALTWNPHHHYA